MTVIETNPSGSDADAKNPYVTPRDGAPKQAAHGIEQIDVRAVNSKADRSLFATRAKIHPKLTHGTFRNVKWLVMAGCLAVYYLVPWLRWDRGEGLPNQAILFDVENGRIFLFGLAIWPQELYLVTGFLVLSALALFLVTAVLGRVWCGYLCWQTVWTDMMVSVERFFQGDRNQRILLDKQPWGLSKIYKKSMTHITWVLIGVVTGGAFTFYFRDAPTLFVEFLTGEAPMIAYLFLALFTFMTYLMGGIAREQVCIYMCPWPRIQGAMFDKDSLLITYRDFRGEPRGPHRKSESWDDRGECIDCKACVAVCPMGIDIREGPQLECIQCGLCIDACNDIMTRIDRPQNLIAYDTFSSIENEKKGGGLSLRLIRPRTILYTSLLLLVAAVVGVAAMSKSELEMNVIAERNPFYVQLSDGSVRNAYTIKILNKRYEPHTFTLATTGIDGAILRISGMDDQTQPKITVVPDDLREIRAFVTVPADKLGNIKGERTDINFIANDVDTDNSVTRVSTFRRPSQ